MNTVFMSFSFLERQQALPLDCFMAIWRLARCDLRLFSIISIFSVYALTYKSKRKGVESVNG
jgi:hypothetical protein